MNRLKILVVDDDKITTNILLKMLENDQRELRLASSGKEGLELFDSFRPDIVLSDINMPGMNGLEMIKAIRAKDDQVKIAIFTNFDNKPYLLEAIHLGVNQFFCKPFEKEHFLQVINRLSTEIMEKRQIQASLKRHRNILETVNTMSQRFLQQRDWDATLSAEIRSVMQAAEASTIFIFCNDGADDPKLARSYIAINDNSDADPSSLLSYKTGTLAMLNSMLKAGNSFNGVLEDVDVDSQALFYEHRVNALLILPIFSQNSWWGFLGIGNNDHRRFDETDQNTLKTVAQLIGAALDSQNNINMLEMRSAIFKHTVDGVIITNADNRILHVNDAFTTITGFRPEQVYGKDPKILRSGQHDKNFYRQLWKHINEEGYWQGEIKNRTADGEMYIAWLSINAITNRKGEVENYIAVFSDVTTQRSHNEKYVHLATHDALTGLANRLILSDRLEHAVLHAERTQTTMAVFFCDLDNFKPINDTYGHDVGDKVLQHCADYFKKVLRAEDTICRYGGDEFIILLEELPDHSKLRKLTGKIMALTEESVEHDGHTIPIEMSVGVSIFPTDGVEGNELIKNADEAMYVAKKSGKNQIHCYQEMGCFLYGEDTSADDLDFSI
jgi:diguanylate cyclase (GGDEF)-like protein/PAS domain S-box-containing protein